jgi:hypothetical protein
MYYIAKYAICSLALLSTNQVSVQQQRCQTVRLTLQCLDYTLVKCVRVVAVPARRLKL